MVIKKRLIKDIIRYTFFLALFFWIVVSIYIGYQYVARSSTQVTTKWWTFVEGIFWSTSYLPYLRNDIQSSFYQGLVFNACLKSAYDNTTISYVPDLCEVTTKDNKTYSVNLHKWFIRSDGTPVSLEDIYFTYTDILRNNMWKLSSLTQYNTITTEKDVNNTLKVTFPTASSDNILFFTNYILPKHVLTNTQLADYKSMFAFNPVYTNCANLVSQSKDEYSLVFNIVNCPQSNLNYYQVKNTISFDSFHDDIQAWWKSIIDAYVWDETLVWYEAQKILTNKLITVFFNTRSEKLHVRGRRVLWGLIKHNFYITWYENHFQKNDDGLFDAFQSTWAGVKDLINREYNDNIITKDDLIDTNIKSLSESISIKGENQKFVYFIDTWSSISTQLTFDAAYDKAVLEYKWKTYALKHFVQWWKSGWFIFGNKEWTLWSWLNQYTIYGYKSTKKILLASLDIYNVIPEATETEYTWAPVELIVVYYKNSINDFVVETLKSIFSEANITENFIFEEITTPEELQWRLMVGDYDLLINTVDMGLKKDLTKLFSTDKSEINPSQYQSSKLTTLLTQYMLANDKWKIKPLNDINSIYSKDMPFVILGKEYLTLNIKSSLAEKLFASWYDAQIDEYNRRDYVYRNLELVSNIHIDGKKIRNFDNFSNFLTEAIKTTSSRPEATTETDNTETDTNLSGNIE